MVAASLFGGNPEAAADAPVKKEGHVCRGLNACKGQGADGKNDCAGMGNCSTVEKHGCKGENACKGQGGGCVNAGENACKGMGDCSVPLDGGAWKKARAKFEAKMKKAGTSFGNAPKAK